MKNKLVLSFAAFVLAFALPVGSAFASTSPNADSPNVNSPNVNSPNVNSPNVDSPNVDSPNVDSPAINATNVVANSLGGSAVSAQESASVSGEGALLSPHSGALNLAAVAGATVGMFALAGVSASILRRKLKQ